jgi:hypothetical protein
VIIGPPVAAPGLTNVRTEREVPTDYG